MSKRKSERDINIIICSSIFFLHSEAYVLDLDLVNGVIGPSHTVP